MAKDPAGIAMAYDRYAADLFGYSHWILHDSAAAAGALKDTFVLAAATLGNLSEPSKLRPWLFALARNECRRRIRPMSAAHGEVADVADEPADAPDQLSDAGADLSDATMQFRAVGPLADVGEDLSDLTVQFYPVGRSADAGRDLSDATVQFRAVGRPADAGEDLSDATLQFRAVGPLADAGEDLSDLTQPVRALRRSADAGEDLSDATVQFRAVGRPADAGEDLSDATVQFRVISQLADPITPFRVIGQPTHGPSRAGGDQGQAELRSLIDSTLAGLKRREREVIELSFRHDLHDNDLAIALGVSQSRAHDLSARARGRLEEALGALDIALTGRKACSALGDLLADWDGQLTEQTRDLVRLAQGGVPDLRPSRMGRNAPSGVSPPAAAGPAARGTAGAGAEPLYLHR